MKKTLVFVALLMSSGCWMLGSPDIQCWYSVSHTQQISEPWFELHGRTDRYRVDVCGPMFRTQQELDQYVTSHNLVFCGSQK